MSHISPLGHHPGIYIQIGTLAQPVSVESSQNRTQNRTKAVPSTATVITQMVTVTSIFN
jgi:hypothetical protein